MHCLKGSVADRLLFFFMILSIGVLWFYIQQQLGQGIPTAYVYHQHQLIAEYPIPTDERVIHVHALGEIGDSEIEISKEGIRFLHSPCSTHHCTLAGQKSHAGSVLACVPNHIMVTIRGRSATETITFDAVAE